MDDSLDYKRYRTICPLPPVYLKKYEVKPVNEKTKTEKSVAVQAPISADGEYTVTVFGTACKTMRKGKILKLNRTFSKKITSLDEIEGLMQISGLSTLDLSGQAIRDISQLRAFPELKNLYLTGNEGVDLHALESTWSLEKLVLGRGTNPKNVEKIKNLRKLTILTLVKADVRDVSFLANLKRLRESELSENQIVDVKPLANLTNLKNLKLDRNQIVDVSPLAVLTKLENLDLYENPVTDLSSLEVLKPKTWIVKPSLVWTKVRVEPVESSLKTKPVTGESAGKKTEVTLKLGTLEAEKTEKSEKRDDLFADLLTEWSRQTPERLAKTENVKAQYEKSAVLSARTTTTSRAQQQDVKKTQGLGKNESAAAVKSETIPSRDDLFAELLKEWSRQSEEAGKTKIKQQKDLEGQKELEEQKKNFHSRLQSILTETEKQREAERKKEQEEARKKAQEEAERKTQEEAQKKAQEEAQKKAQEEAQRKVQEEARKKAQEEAQKKAQEEAQRKAQEEAQKKAQEEAQKKAQEEAQRKAQKKAQEEAQKKAQKNTWLTKVKAPEITRSGFVFKRCHVAWDCIWFGHYPQKRKADGTFSNELICWRVLNVENGKALLLSDLILDAETFSITGKSGNVIAMYKDIANRYDNSPNEQSFYYRAFSKAERNAILHVASKVNFVKSEYISDAAFQKYGFNYQGKVITESCVAAYSDYAVSRGLNANYKFGTWLLSGTTRARATMFCVNEFGVLCSTKGVSTHTVGIRPMIEVDLNLMSGIRFEARYVNTNI